MKRLSLKLILPVFLLVSVAGCFENIFTALSKLANGQISQLTANEIKLLNQLAIDIGKSQNPPVHIAMLTDAQAQALADFAKANNINTIEQLQNLPQQMMDGVPLEGLDALAMAFGNDPGTFDADALAAILQQIATQT
jgi:hypothetical protein